MSQITVTAEFTDLREGPTTKREVVLEYIESTGWIRMLGGPTGYESFEAREYQHRGVGKPWTACFGTEGRYQRCEVPAPEMARAAAALGFGEEVPELDPA